jgi:hypothetical protein
MKVDANGAVSKAGARGDFGTGHALDEAKDQSFAIAFGEGENGVESCVGFGGGMGAGRRRGSRRSGFWGGRFFDKLVERLTAAVKVRGAIASDGGEPAGEFGDFAERGETREGSEKNVLDEVVDVGVRDAGEKDAVDHAGVTGVKKTEGGTIALLGGADEGVVGAAVLLRSVHSRETGAGRMEFKECRHVASMEMKSVT